jgi:hypothetical protein
MVTKKEGGQEGDSNSDSVWHCGDWGVILNLNVFFFCNSHYFLIRLLQLFE